MNRIIRLVAGCVLILSLGADRGFGQEPEQLAYYFGLDVLSEPAELQVEVGGKEELCLYGVLRRWLMDDEAALLPANLLEQLTVAQDSDRDQIIETLDRRKDRFVAVRQTLDELESRLLPVASGVSSESREKTLKEFAATSGSNLGLTDPVRVSDAMTFYRWNTRYTVVYLQDEAGTRLEILTRKEIEQLPYYFGLDVLSEPMELQVDVGGGEELALYGVLQRWIVDALPKDEKEFRRRAMADTYQEAAHSIRQISYEVATVQVLLPVLERRLLPEDPGMAPESRKKVLEEFAATSGAVLGLSGPVRVADTATFNRGTKRYTVIHLKDEKGTKLEILMPETATSPQY